MEKYNHTYTDYGNDIVKATNSILKERGIADYQEFINPSDKSLDTRMLNNLDKASEMLLKHINNNSRILILIDSDVDGLTSASLCYDGIKNIAEHFEKKPRLGVINHKTKVHGVDMILDRLEGRYDKIDLLIAPDSSSDDIKGMRELDRHDTDFLVLDHHPYKIADEDLPSNTVRVNNTVGGISSGLSGVGVVWKLMKYIDEENWIDFADDYLDVLATGLVGDSMPCTDEEVNYFVRKGLKNITNKLLVEIIGEKKLDGVSPKTIAFDVNPKLNVMFRQGVLKEKRLMFEAMSKMGEGKRFENKRAKSKDGTITIEHHFRLLSNRVKKSEKALVDSVDSGMVDISKNGKLGMLDISKTDLEGGISGMLASKLSKKFNIPFLVYDSENKCKGSCRSPIAVKDLFYETKQFQYCLGHDCAFGIGLKKGFDIDKIAKAIEHYESDLIADLLIEESEINAGVIGMVGLINRNIYSSACDKLTLNTTIGYIEEDDFYVNEAKTMMKIKRGGFDYVLFNPTDIMIQRFKSDPNNIEVIVEPSLNEFSGSISYQLIVLEVV